MSSSVASIRTQQVRLPTKTCTSAVATGIHRRMTRLLNLQLFQAESLFGVQGKATLLRNAHICPTHSSPGWSQVREKSGLTVHRVAYREHQRTYSKTLKVARSRFYSALISDSRSNSRQLFFDQTQSPQSSNFGTKGNYRNEVQ